MGYGHKKAIADEKVYMYVFNVHLDIFFKNRDAFL